MVAPDRKGGEKMGGKERDNSSSGHMDGERREQRALVIGKTREELEGSET